MFDADDLRDNPENRRPLIAEQTVKRGTIKTADGVTIAESFPVGDGKNPIYVREYPQGDLFGHPVGYSFIEVGRSGIERSENGFLAGERNERIRTYNFPQNRVTDHRIELTLYNLPAVIEGDVDPIIEPLMSHDLEERLKSIQA